MCIGLGVGSGFGLIILASVAANNFQLGLGNSIAVISVFGASGTLVGGGIGAIVSSQKIKIPINGDINNYRKQKSKIEKLKKLD